MLLSTVLVGEGHTLYEGVSATAPVYGLPHTLVKAAVRGSHDLTEDKMFYKVPWDCHPGILVIGTLEECTAVYNKIVQEMESVVDEPFVLDDLDQVQVPHRIAILAPPNGKGPHVVIGEGMVEDCYNEIILDIIQPTDTMWSAEIGANINDFDPVSGVVDFLLETPTTPFRPMLIAYLYYAVQSEEMQHPSNQQWLNGFPTITADIAAYQATLKD